MDYSAENVKRIAAYIKSGEKKPGQCSIGMEFEHILVYRDTLKSVTYDDAKGMESIFLGLEKKGWDLTRENNRILGAVRDGDAITLEPGGQVEVSVKHTLDLGETERRYLLFLEDIKPILDNNGQGLIALGYHPASVIEEIPFIPKRRYVFMSKYLGEKDTHGHHMMKGSASAQVVIDYANEEDFIKKFRVANSLTVVLSYLFDNTPVFEGKPWEHHMARTNIWNHVDKDRSGVMKGSLDQIFGYDEYAAYVWNKPVVIGLLDGAYEFAGEQTTAEVYRDRLMSEVEIEHVLSMFFPDVRAKRYIEIRMCDSVPHPWNVSLAALVKGIFYDPDNLEFFYQTSKEVTEAMVQDWKDAMISGDDRLEEVKAQGELLLNKAMEGLDAEGQRFLEPLLELFHAQGNMATLLKKSIEKGDPDPFGRVFAT
ncbi:glutamate--cysteine ligase [Alkalibacter rhizosphaerae]|uniref:Glutamate--cysteine ligase n=1 Tax=Alkalibacter rhizosphaerae TaxID=2815577 RepID=A0A975AGT6_9FIRM|nr:glutamate-cysteine ligase family protein [Alkalibacter rhizosphaerae]QSX07894.1 glutamate--cysteine ligase [Alkalibacter rhizosphaerae]